VDFESDEGFSATVGDPESLDARIVAYVSKHVWVILGRADKFYSGQDGFVRPGKELEYGSISPADDDAPVDEGERRRYIVTVDLVGSVRKTIVDIPNGEARIFGDGSD